MARVSFITFAATYQGDLELSSPTGGAVRFLDALNFPQRLVHARPSPQPALQLRDATRRDDLRGAQTACGPTFSLRLGAILVAYEVSAVELPLDVRAVAYEARRHAQDLSRVLVLMQNGLRIECNVGGGVQAFDGGKQGSDFVACQNVELVDPRRSERARPLPFAAINVRHIEGAAAAVAADAEGARPLTTT